MFNGKVAFMTGGGSGIGRGIAERLAREGADVSIGEIDIPGAEETAGSKFRWLPPACSENVMRNGGADLCAATRTCIDRPHCHSIAYSRYEWGRTSQAQIKLNKAIGLEHEEGSRR